LLFGILLTVVALVLQTNPAVVQEPNWDSPTTRALAQRACFDCHSNQTVYPWYDKLPVASWITSFDVLRGRRELNFSEWRPLRRPDELTEKIQEGEMPPAMYVLIHPEAKLTPDETQALIDGLRRTVGTTGRED
jgi:hypothetical protein